MKVLAYLILLSFLLRPLLPLVDYCVNHEYIAKVLCENKEKPKMKCNGKCHLMKEIAKNTSDEKPATPNKKNFSIDTEYLFADKMKSAFGVLIIIQNQSYKVYKNLYRYSFHLYVFHPPLV